MPNIHLFVISVEQKVWIIFVNRIIREMHAHIRHIILIRLLIGFRSKPSQSLFENIHS